MAKEIGILYALIDLDKLYFFYCRFAQDNLYFKVSINSYRNGELALRVGLDWQRLYTSNVDKVIFKNFTMLFLQILKFKPIIRNNTGIYKIFHTVKYRALINQ